MFTEFKGFIERLVRRYDKIGRYTEDFVADINYKLIASDFLASFRTYHQEHLPEMVTGAAIPALLGINWGQWRTAQWYRTQGLRQYSEGYRINREPKPVLIAPIPVTGRGGSKKAVYYTEEVLATAPFFKKKTMVPLIVRRAQFENYLRVSVRNHFKNCIRTIGRHDQDIYKAPNEDGSSWENDIEEHQDTAKEEILVLMRAHSLLGKNYHKVLQMLDNKVPLDTALHKLKLGITISDLRRTLVSDRRGNVQPHVLL